MSGDEELRELERRAREVDDAASWSRLAFALQRLGRAGDAQGAAHRALARDPEDASRSLLRVAASSELGFITMNQSVAWPGLRTVHAPRTLASFPRPRRHSGLVDLGDGLALVQSDELSERARQIFAVDMLRGTTLWTRTITEWGSLHACMTGGRVVLVRDVESRGQSVEAGVELTVLERNSGAVVMQRFVRLPTIERSHQLSRGGHYLLSPVPLDDDGIATGIVGAEDEGDSRVVVLAVVDVAGHMRWERRFENARCLSVCATSFGLIAHLGTRMVALSATGDEIWARNGELEAVVEDRALAALSRDEGCEVAWLDTTTGQTIGSSKTLPCSHPLVVLTGNHIVMSNGAATLAVDRMSLDRAWERQDGTNDLAGLVATADTVIRLENHPWRRGDEEPRSDCALAAATALDADSGALLSRMSLGEPELTTAPVDRVGCDAALIAGRLLVSSCDSRPGMFLLGEPS